MAVNLDKTTDYLDVNPSPWKKWGVTWSFWFRTSDLSNYQYLLTDGNGSVGIRYVSIHPTLDRLQATRRWTTYQNARPTLVLSENVWYHGAVTWNTQDEHHAWVNGGYKDSNTTSAGVMNLNSAIFGLGSYEAGGGDCDGDLAEIAIYDGILTEDEIKSLAAGHCPLSVRPDLLSGYYPLGGLLVPKASLLDRWGSSTLTSHGTPDAQDHPGGIIYPSGPRRVLVPSPTAGGAIAGSSSITLGATGSIGAKGALAGSASFSFAPTAAIGGRGALGGVAAVGFSTVASVQALGTLAGAASLGFTPAGVL